MASRFTTVYEDLASALLRLRLAGDELTELRELDLAGRVEDVAETICVIAQTLVDLAENTADCEPEPASCWYCGYYGRADSVEKGSPRCGRCNWRPKEQDWIPKEAVEKPWGEHGTFCWYCGSSVYTVSDESHGSNVCATCDRQWDPHRAEENDWIPLVKLYIQRNTKK